MALAQWANADYNQNTCQYNQNIGLRADIGVSWRSRIAADVTPHAGPETITTWMLNERWLRHCAIRSMFGFRVGHGPPTALMDMWSV